MAGRLLSNLGWVARFAWRLVVAWNAGVHGSSRRDRELLDAAALCGHLPTIEGGNGADDGRAVGGGPDEQDGVVGAFQPITKRLGRSMIPQDEADGDAADVRSTT